MTARRRAGPVATVVVLLAAGLPASVAHGQKPSTDAVVVNVAALYYGVGELRWEHRLAERSALQASLAAGPGSQAAGLTDHWLGKIGVKYRYYFAGGFDEGLGLAVEVAGLRLLADPYQRQGLALSPRGVYKIAISSGATAELQIGGALVARAGVDASGEAMPLRWTVQASIAAALGWSF